MLNHLFKVFFGLLVLLTACAAPGNATPTDDSLLTGQPCAPPCWQGLTPGQTSSDEVLQFLKTSPLVAGNLAEALAPRSGQGWVQHWLWANVPQDSSQINFADFDAHQTLKSISLSPNTMIRAQEVISIYGTPTLMAFALSAPPDIFSNRPTGVLVTALFTPQAFRIIWFEPNALAENPVVFCPTLTEPIIEVDYYTAGIAAYYDDNFRHASPSASNIVDGSLLIHLVDQQPQAYCINIPK